MSLSSTATDLIRLSPDTVGDLMQIAKDNQATIQEQPTHKQDLPEPEEKE